MSNATISSDTVVVAREDLLSSNLSEEELVMLDFDRGFYFGLEAVAKVIWEQLAEPKDVKAVCAEVVAKFDGEASAVEQDTIEFLTSLLDENLIMICDSAHVA